MSIKVYSSNFQKQKCKNLFLKKKLKFVIIRVDYDLCHDFKNVLFILYRKNCFQRV